jgi:hypothetical protein
MKEYNKDDNTVVCIVDNIDNCLPHTKSILRNISDQFVFKLCEKYSVLVDKNLDAMLEYAKSKYNYVIIATTGTDILHPNVIKITGTITNLCDQISSEYKLHLMDKIDLANTIFYLDGTDETKFSEGMLWQLKKYNLNNNLFYPINNEPVHNLKIPIIHQLITPCAGTNWINYLNKYGYDETTTVRFYDNNYLALDCMRKIIEWDGNDYEKFIISLGQEKFSFLNKPWDYGFASLYEKPNIDNWNKITSTVNFEFRLINILESFNIDEIIDDKPNTFINFSNIFTYYLTSAFYSLEYKTNKEKELLDSLKKYDCYVGFVTRSLSVYSDQLLHGHITEFTDSADINLPTWYD